MSRVNIPSQSRFVPTQTIDEDREREIIRQQFLAETPLREGEIGPLRAKAATEQGEPVDVREAEARAMSNADLLFLYSNSYRSYLERRGLDTPEPTQAEGSFALDVVSGLLNFTGGMGVDVVQAAKTASDAIGPLSPWNWLLSDDTRAEFDAALDIARDNYLSGRESPWDNEVGEMFRLTQERANSGSPGAIVGQLLGNSIPSVGSMIGGARGISSALNARVLALYSTSSAGRGIAEYTDEVMAQGGLPDARTALMVGIGHGAAEALSEKLGDILPIQRLTSGLAAEFGTMVLERRDFRGAARFLTNLSGQAVSEGVEEVIAGELQALVSLGTYGKEYDRSWSDRMTEFGLGGAGAAMASTLASGLSRRVRNLYTSPPPPASLRALQRLQQEIFESDLSSPDAAKQEIVREVFRASRGETASEIGESARLARARAEEIGRPDLAARIDALANSYRERLLSNEVSKASNTEVISEYALQLAERGLDITVREVAREDLTAEQRGTVEGLEALGMRVVTVADDPANPLPAMASALHNKTVVVSVGEKMDARAVAAVVAHELIHVIRKSDPDIYYGLLREAAGPIVATAHEYVATLIDSGLTDDAIVTSAVTERFIEEGAARFVEQMIGRAGILSSLRTDQVPLFERLMGKLKRASLKVGLGGVGEQAVLRAFERLADARAVNASFDDSDARITGTPAFAVRQQVEPLARFEVQKTVVNTVPMESIKLSSKERDSILKSVEEISDEKLARVFPGMTPEKARKAATKRAMHEAKKLHARYHPSAGWAKFEVSGAKVHKDKDILVLKTPKIQYNLESDAKRLKQSKSVLARRLADRFIEVKRQADAGDPNAIIKMRSVAWYKQSALDARIRFGSYYRMFQELLGALSPRTPVAANYNFAVQLMTDFLKGKHDDLMAKFIEFVKAEEADYNAAVDLNEKLSEEIDAEAAEIKLIPDKAERETRRAALNEKRKRRNEAKKRADGSVWRKKKWTGELVSQEQSFVVGELQPNAFGEETNTRITANYVMQRLYAGTTENIKRRVQMLRSDNPNVEIAETKDANGKTTGATVANGTKLRGKTKFGANSFLGMIVLAGNWLHEVEGRAPKTFFFTSNLLDLRSAATIDVWVARAVRSLMGAPKIPPRMEASVRGSTYFDENSGDLVATGDYRFAQDILSEAVSILQSEGYEINRPDDLQAFLWFDEKEHWATVDATNEAGEGGDFSDEARKHGMSRFTVGITNQTLNFVPTDSELKEFVQPILDTLRADPKLVAASPTITQGSWLDGGKTVVEKSLAFDVVTKPGFSSIGPTVQSIVKQAKLAEQKSVMISRALQPEDVAGSNARPSLEVNFKRPIGMAEFERMQEIVMRSIPVGATAITDVRYPGEIVGIRSFFTPEWTDPSFLRDDDETRAKKLKDAESKMLEAIEAVRKAYPNDVGNAEIQMVDTLVFGEGGFDFDSVYNVEETFEGAKSVPSWFSFGYKELADAYERSKSIGERIRSADGGDALVQPAFASRPRTIDPRAADSYQGVWWHFSRAASLWSGGLRLSRAGSGSAGSERSYLRRQRGRVDRDTASIFLYGPGAQAEPSVWQSAEQVYRVAVPKPLVNINSRLWERLTEESERRGGTDKTIREVVREAGYGGWYDPSRMVGRYIDDIPGESLKQHAARTDYDRFREVIAHPLPQVNFAARRRPKDAPGQQELFGTPVPLVEATGGMTPSVAEGAAAFARPAETPSTAEIRGARAKWKSLSDLDALIRSVFVKRDAELVDLKSELDALISVALPVQIQEGFQKLLAEASTRSQIVSVMNRVYTAAALARSEADRKLREHQVGKIEQGMREALREAERAAENAADPDIAQRIADTRQAIEQLRARSKEAGKDDRALIREQIKSQRAQLGLMIREERAASKEATNRRIARVRSELAAAAAESRKNLSERQRERIKALREGFARRVLEIRQAFARREKALEDLRREAGDILTSVLPADMQGRYIDRIARLKTRRQFERLMAAASAALQKRHQKEYRDKVRDTLKRVTNLPLHPDEEARLKDLLEALSINPKFPGSLSEKKREWLEKRAAWLQANPNALFPKSLLRQLERLTNRGLKDLSAAELFGMLIELEGIEAVHDQRSTVREMQRSRVFSQAEASVAAELAASSGKAGPVRDDLGRRNVSRVRQMLTNLMLYGHMKAKTLTHYAFGEGSVGERIFYRDLSRGANSRLAAHQRNVADLAVALANAGVEPGSDTLAQMSVAMSDQRNLSNKIIGPVSVARSIKPNERKYEMANGTTATMTDAEAISLYGMLSDPMVMDRILLGNPIVMSRGGKPFVMDAESISRFRSSVPPHVAQIASAMHALYNGKMQQELRDWMVRNRGTDETVEGYWPTRRTGWEREITTEEIGDRSLRSAGILYERVNSRLAYEVGDAFSTFVSHSWISSSVSYLEESLRLAKRVLASDSVRQAAERWAVPPTKSLDGLVRAMNSEALGQGLSDPDQFLGPLVSKLTTNITQAALAWNPFVLALQPMSLVNAANEIPAQVLAAAFASGAPVDMGIDLRIKRFSAYLRNRLDSSGVGIWNENDTARGAILGYGAEGRFMLGTLSFMDAMAIRTIWKAAEAMVAKQYGIKDLDAAGPLVAEIAERVVMDSQATSDILHQSGIAREGRRHPAVRALIMFTSQLNANWNQVARAAIRVQRAPDDKDAWVKLAKAILFALIMSSVSYRALVYLRNLATGRDASLEKDIVGGLALDTLQTIHVFGPLTSQVIESQVLGRTYGNRGADVLPAFQQMYRAGEASARTIGSVGDLEGLVAEGERAMVAWARVFGVPTSPYTLTRDIVFGGPPDRPRKKKRQATRI